MKLSCEYKTEKIPMYYQMLFVSLIKEALKKSDKKYFESLYIYEETKRNKRTKDFCFSVYMKNFSKEEDIFIIKDKVIFNISSPNYEFMIKLYNGLLNINNFKYKEFSIDKVKINLVNDKEIQNGQQVFNTLSPICVKDKENKYLNIDDSNFNKELNYISNKILENFRGYGLVEELKFYPIKMKKKVVKEDISAFRENTKRQYYYVNSYAGIFKLEGNVKDLKDIYMLGLGFKRNQGFGMIEVIG
ncbi:MAG: CRISPR-associated endoribonuclease Cas6 [Clostridium sp.]|uniref:CRISPR-associated endoribonuclease Cas6 n=1 Tax=Clostridium TaxID=1485 RepID=UPI000E17CB4D|nr:MULTISPECIES: CRISPR-associated endoribonuclease Cas6 [Clostridium]MDU7251852.1 CRISPR-associated endoribonuclease Cas6 [Clostridium sp.]SUY64393.1 CRISPR-associated endoribonuclease Cas6 [Clostridium sporogenes]